MMTFGEHLEELRHVLFRVLTVTLCVAVVVFCLRSETFDLLLAPSRWDFCTYRWIERMVAALGMGKVSFDGPNMTFITTELGAQFMAHLKVAVAMGALVASPYIIYEIFRFIAPALYANERRVANRLIGVVYVFFLVGVCLSYFLLFPISFRFLALYEVSERVHATITLDSYLDTLITLTVMMGAVFQLPIVSFLLSRMGVLKAGMLRRYRRHAFVLIMLVAAIITPPDIMTLLVVSLPLYLLFELSIWVVSEK